MEQTELELHLETKGIFTVRKVFDVLIQNKIENITYVNIYQYGRSKKGNIYHATIRINDEFVHFEGIKDVFEKKVREFTNDKLCVTNYEGKAIRADLKIIDQIENHLKKFIDVKQVIGSHELINALVKRI